MLRWCKAGVKLSSSCANRGFSKTVASDQPFALIVCAWEVNNLLGLENSSALLSIFSVVRCLADQLPRGKRSSFFS